MIIRDRYKSNQKIIVADVSCFWHTLHMSVISSGKHCDTCHMLASTQTHLIKWSENKYLPYKLLWWGLGWWNKVKLFLRSQYCHVNICLDKLFKQWKLNFDEILLNNVIILTISSLRVLIVKWNPILNDISWSCYTKGNE